MIHSPLFLLWSFLSRKIKHTLKEANKLATKEATNTSLWMDKKMKAGKTKIKLNSKETSNIMLERNQGTNWYCV